ncbi:MAG: hypothetical protein JST05_09870 [Acidobacteria bacterium]|nr:hypothetical protein [Acidobacteriota bacterium]
MALLCVAPGLLAAPMPRSGEKGSDTPSLNTAKGSGAEIAGAIYTVRSDSDLQLYQLVMNGKPVGDPIAGFPSPNGGMLLPLGQLSDLLQFSLKVDPSQGLVNGTLWNEQEVFQFDLRKGTVLTRNGSLRFPAGLAEAHPDDIYVDASLLSTWWPVHFELSPRSLSVKATPTEETPAQASARRLREGHALQGHALAAGGSSLPRTDTPYRALELDSLDVSGQASWAQSDSTTRYTGGIAAAGDLLWMSGYASYQGMSDGSHSFLGWMERQDPEGGLLGPLNAQQVALGDVASQPLGLITVGGQGPGVLVSSFQPGREIRNDKRTFTGALPDGWQAELYVNGLLQGFQASRPDGFYEFRDIPMSYGLNEIKIVLYGPRGERREIHSKVETQNLVAGVHEFKYSFFAGKPFDRLRRATFQSAYGLSRDWNLIAGAAGLELNSQGSTLDMAGPHTTHAYAVGGLQGQWDGVGLQATIASDSTGGTAESASARTRLGAWTVGASRVWLQDFVSEEFQTMNGRIRARTSFDFSGSIPNLTSPILGIGGSYQVDQYYGGGEADRANLYLGSSIGRWSLSNQFTGTRDSRFSMPMAINGLFLVSRSFQWWNLRGSAGYSVAPDSKLETLGATADTSRIPSWYLSATSMYSVQGRDWTHIASALKSQGRFSFGASISHSSVGGWGATVSFHVGLSRDKLRGGWLPQAQQATAQSLIEAQAFVDANRNGRYDTGERTVPGATFGMSGYGGRGLSGPDGIGVMAGAPPWTDLRVGITPPDGDDGGSLYKVETPVQRILSRPGYTTVIGFPVSTVAQVNGTLYGRSPADTQALGGKHVELVGADGKVIESVRTAFDGYFEFNKVPAGMSYTLRLLASEAEALKVQNRPERAVQVPSEGGYVDGQDLIVDLPGEAAPPPVPPPPPVAPPPGEQPISVSINGSPAMALTDPNPPATGFPAQLRDAVLHGDPKQAAQLSKAWLAQADLKGWAVRAQIGALPTTLLQAAEELDPKDGAILLRPWALSNGQCARQFFVAGFKTKALAERFAARLRGRKDLDPAKVIPVKDLIGAEPPCSFYAN